MEVLDLRQDPDYIYILEAYIEDLEEIVPALKDYLENDLEMYKIKVHGIKGISRQLGREEIADKSEIMEMAVKAGHIPFIHNHFEDYINSLHATIADAKVEYASLEE